MIAIFLKVTKLMIERQSFLCLFLIQLSSIFFNFHKFDCTMVHTYLKVRENQKNDAEISIAILNIPFCYLKLLQLCCLNFRALSFKREGAKEASFLEVKLFTRRHNSNHYPALKNFKCRIVIWNI